jgi:hypothetical protein
LTHFDVLTSKHVTVRSRMTADAVHLIILFLFSHRSSSVLNKAETLHCIFLVYSLILIQHTEYPDLFLWFSSVLPGMCQDISPMSLYMFPTPLFPMHYSLLFMRSDGVEYILLIVPVDRLCGLVVRVSGYRYRGSGFDSRRYQFF